MSNAPSPWTSPYAVVNFSEFGVPIAAPVGCRVVEITPGNTWDVVFAQSAQPAAIAASYFSVAQLSLNGAPAFFGVTQSPVTYSGPGEQPIAVRIRSIDAAGAPFPVPSGCSVMFRATRNSGV
jgi:hypothetical protein